MGADTVTGGPVSSQSNLPVLVAWAKPGEAAQLATGGIEDWRGVAAFLGRLRLQVTEVE